MEEENAGLKQDVASLENAVETVQGDLKLMEEEVTIRVATLNTARIRVGFEISGRAHYARVWVSGC